MSGFEGERWTAAAQELLFGSAVIGRTADWRVERELIFYPDDLPDAGVATLRKFVGESTWCRGARPRKEEDAEPELIWRQETQLGVPVNRRSIKVQLLPLSEFLKVFYCIAYEDRALVIGYNLPRALTRLASDWHEVKKGKYVGAWKLVLWTFQDPNTGKRRPSAGWRPRIILKRVTPDVTFIAFAERRGSRYRGEFLDLANLAHALTGRHWTLADALSTFAGETVERHRDYGRITPNQIDYCRRDVHATVQLAGRLVSLFDRLHPVSRGRPGGFVSEARLFSPGGLARAYFAAARWSPPGVPTDRLGPCCAASFGGWAEVQVRGRIPVMLVDFRREYQTVFLLQGLQELLAAERLEFVEDTSAVREFVSSFTPDALFRPETYRKLNMLCWIKSTGEVLVKRAAFKAASLSGSDRFVMARGPRYSNQPVCAYLADVVAAMLAPGSKAPEILHAERIVPIGRQASRRTRLVGGAVFDPRKHQFAGILVEEGERCAQGTGSYTDIPDAIRKEIVRGIKAIGNIACFGTLSETRSADLLSGRREEVTLLSDTESVRAAVVHPEEPGPFACPPIAGLVSATGRLLLAAVHNAVERRGGIVAACDTDGAHIVSTEKGGTVYVDSRGADFYEGGRAQPVHALSYSEVEEIAALFDPLNPFDRALLPGSPLRVKGASKGLFIAAKRYELTGPDGNFVDRMESILGMLHPPLADWIDEAWRTISEIWDGRLLTPRHWFGLPAMRQLSLTSPAHARQIRGLPRLRPWNSVLVASALGRSAHNRGPSSALVVAAFEEDPERWATLDWHFADTGKPVPLDRPDADDIRWRLVTLREFLSTYTRHPIPEMLAPDGSPCGPFTRGVLRRRPTRDGEQWLVLKEAAVWGDDPRHAFSAPLPEKIRVNRSTASADWDKIQPALVVIGPTGVARKMGLAERSARAWAAGTRQPEDPGEVARAIVAVANEAGLTLPDRRTPPCRGYLPRTAVPRNCGAMLDRDRHGEACGALRRAARACSRDCPRRWAQL
jgi:hypothetical protein